MDDPLSLNFLFCFQETLFFPNKRNGDMTQLLLKKLFSHFLQKLKLELEFPYETLSLSQKSLFSLYVGQLKHFSQFLEKIYIKLCPAH